jgi:hypothetical protein
MPPYYCDSSVQITEQKSPNLSIKTTHINIGASKPSQIQAGPVSGQKHSNINRKNSRASRSGNKYAGIFIIT